MIPLLSLLVFHGLLGGFDVVVNHEIAECLPSRVSARAEQALHSGRELIFAILFGSLAWLQWGGELVWGIAGLLVLELVVSLWDTLLEDETRRLSVLERSMHVLLFINFGAYTSLLVPILVHWYVAPTEFQVVYYGPLSWILSMLALASLAWSIRDGIACIALHRKARAAETSFTRIDQVQAQAVRKHRSADVSAR
jgi:hypothetical protein